MFLKRVTQITDSHCGPAVVQMLLSYHEIDITQEEITRASGAEDQIEVYGVTVEQMALAVQLLAPEVVLYYKQYASVSDIEMLLREYQLPVGIEWQGLFYDSLEEEEKGEDYGHYSIVTEINYDKKVLTIVDPYTGYTTSDRIVEIYKFLNRWWDVNEVKDPLSGERIQIRDDKMLFVISPQNPKLTYKLGMKTYY